VRDVVTPETQGMLVTGPRGSGKTMILRSMRLRTRLHPFSKDENEQAIRTRIANDAHVAFFVSARLDIGNHCALSKLPKWTDSEIVIVYYFYLLYVNEVLDSLYYGIARKIVELDPLIERRFCQFITSALDLSEAQNIATALGLVKAKQASI
jgi:hypothetical protein